MWIELWVSSCYVWNYTTLIPMQGFRTVSDPISILCTKSLHCKTVKTTQTQNCQELDINHCVYPMLYSNNVQTVCKHLYEIHNLNKIFSLQHSVWITFWNSVSNKVWLLSENLRFWILVTIYGQITKMKNMKI